MGRANGDNRGEADSAPQVEEPGTSHVNVDLNVDHGS